MGVRLLISLLALAIVVISDWKRLRRGTAIARTCYIVVILYAMYTASSFVLMRPLPNLNHAVSLVFLKPASAIDAVLKAKEPENEKAGDSSGSI
ncbi:hypothetical protein [Paenibacillus sp. HJGM_3]|uniref:hypothetical protein n=1 Tax=Paenibacillus sp. HJGM_3 TaxID=3379816 RepID=UPI00385AB9E2